PSGAAKRGKKKKAKQDRKAKRAGRARGKSSGGGSEQKERKKKSKKRKKRLSSSSSSGSGSCCGRKPQVLAGRASPEGWTSFAAVKPEWHFAKNTLRPYASEDASPFFTSDARAAIGLGA
ncbi:unnamed protein product, partial [Effrenium voratum]